MHNNDLSGSTPLPQQPLDGRTCDRCSFPVGRERITDANGRMIQSIIYVRRPLRTICEHCNHELNRRAS